MGSACAAPGLAVALALVGCREPPSLVPTEPASAPPAPTTSSIAAPAPSTARASAPAPAALRRSSLVRERRAVVVGGVEEQWRIEWVREPELACFSDWSCMCDGFEFGETGPFDLVRVRPGAPEQRLKLAGTLPRWPLEEAERKAVAEGTIDREAVMERREIEILKLGDYDHDGHAFEFVLQVAAGSPCFRRWSVLVGLDLKKDTLRVFGTDVAPGTPLVLAQPSAWERLREQGKTASFLVFCDHGADRFDELFVVPSTKGFRVRKRVYACEHPDPNGAGVKGKAISDAPYRPEGWESMYDPLRSGD